MKRHERSLAAAVLRYPVLALTHLIAVPLLAVIERLGGTARLLRVVSWAAHFRHPYETRWKGYVPRASDVFVCSYAKSGTNWMLQLAYQVSERGSGEFEHLYDVVAWPDEVVKGYATALEDERLAAASATGRRLIKTHADWDRIPYSEAAKYILVVRDPKDVFVSSYHFLRGAAAGPLMPSVTAWYDWFLTPHFAPGYWPEHAESYWQARDLDNVLFVTFKEMKADLPGTVRKVADFLEIELSESEFGEVCRRSHFDHMKQESMRFAPGLITPWSVPGTETVRRGAQGGASEMLTLAQQKRIDREFRAAFREMGSDFDWERASSPPSE